MKRSVVALSALLSVAFAAFAAERKFEWTPGVTQPSGWCDSFSESDGDPWNVIGPAGKLEKLCVARRGDGLWLPYTKTFDGKEQAKKEYTLIVYGSADMVAPSSGKFGVLWSMGFKGSKVKTVLLKENSGRIKLVQTKDLSNYIRSIDVGTRDGWHLFTVRFKQNDSGAYTASLQIDGGTVYSDDTFELPDVGIQFGSVLGGIEENAEAGNGFVIKRAIGYDTADLSGDEYAAICAEHPSFDKMLMLPGKGGARIFEGMLQVPADMTYSYPSIEFGDKNSDPVFGMDLHGRMEITARQNFDSNDCQQAYGACNDKNGINFGEWTGTGTFNVKGTFSAPNAVAVVCFDSDSTVINVDGGSFTVKGVTAKYSGRATINLVNGGTVNLGKFPSAANTIIKNYGDGTVETTFDSADADAITLTGSADGTTFRAKGAVASYEGSISGEGVCVVEGLDGGVVKFADYNAGDVTVASGTLEMLAADIDGSIEVAAGAELRLDTPGSVVLSKGISLREGATLSFPETFYTRDFVLPKIASIADGAKVLVGGYRVTLKEVDGSHKIAFPDAEGDVAGECVLRFSEIMPKATDSLNPGKLQGMDPNGYESGWVEVENTSEKWADLADYRFVRVNRGKKTDTKGLGNFPSVMIPPKSKFVFWTSERYPNSKDSAESMFTEGTFTGAPEIFPEYGNMLVWGDKVNPKKFPFVRLYYAPDDDTLEVADTVVVPSDLPEGMSIIVGHAADGECTQRWICPTPTRSCDNTPVEGLVALGPNVGPVYEKPNLKKTDVASEFDRIAPPAVPGEDYEIKFAANPVMNPDGSHVPRAADRITGLKLVYRTDLDDSTRKTVDVDMASCDTDDENWGSQYVARIPSSDLPAAGHLIQWKFLITDGSGREWTSPSFNNKDDGYEWYGTIVEPGDLDSKTLPTWHMFVDDASKSQMDIDADAQTLANNARVAIYDSSTSNYYDYVRIDLRGNTSKNFAKKSHGLRFAKAHPLTMKDIVTGETIEEFRKSSLISEFADPSWMRQMMAFWLFRKMGNRVPFDFPVRCNLNGEFFQLAFHSERFTDELIEDYYGFDKFGYGYKNVGTLKSQSGTTAGGIEKKTPDDGNEADISVLENELRKPLKDRGVQESGVEDNASLTKFVVEKFDLAAWINYIASARITHECDDVWANISIYFDDPKLAVGYRGTGTWIPLGYDFNLSFGHWHYNDLGGSRNGLKADEDWFKAHPFYGGNRVRCYKEEGRKNMCGNGNDAFEAVFQSSKFRRLYLRRLRTLMDEQLKSPGTPESEVPFMVEMRRLAGLMRAESVLDDERWPNDGTDNSIDVWGDNRPKGIDAGIDDIWNNYVVPRRVHLYATHSVTNTSFEAGYGSTLNAAIPLAQSDIALLRKGISAEYDATLGAVVVRNANSEVVDISGWRLSGPVEMTIPPGTVLDRAFGEALGEVYVAVDRRRTVSLMEVTDQVIVGNAEASSGPVTLSAADGTKVFPFVELSPVNGIAPLKATTLEEALEEAKDCVVVLSAADIEAGLTPEMFAVTARSIAADGTQHGFEAVLVLNPEVVPAPAFTDGLDALKIVSSSADKVVSSVISNAIKGLWYGYTVTDSLEKPFEEDVLSFKRATSNGPLEITAAPVSSDSAFFKVKVKYIHVDSNE